MSVIGPVLVPEGRKGPWRVERFKVSEAEASLGRLRSIASASRRGWIEAGTYTRLMRDDVVVMSDVPDEREDHSGFVRRAHGRVLIAGLGLGMVLAALLRKPLVTDILVIEKDQNVIDLVGPHYGDDPRLRIVRADIFEALPLIRREPIFDFAWFDIWDVMCANSLPEMTKLKRRFARRCRWQGCWGEDELRRGRRRR